MKSEYREGPVATEKFVRAMKALFQAPKLPSAKHEKKDEPTTLRNSQRLDKD
jgi:hypothetical protein